MKGAALVLALLSVLAITALAQVTECTKDVTSPSGDVYNIGKLVGQQCASPSLSPSPPRPALVPPSLALLLALFLSFQTLPLPISYSPHFLTLLGSLVPSMSSVGLFFRARFPTPFDPPLLYFLLIYLSNEPRLLMSLILNCSIYKWGSRGPELVDTFLKEKEVEEEGEEEREAES